MSNKLTCTVVTKQLHRYMRGMMLTGNVKSRLSLRLKKEKCTLNKPIGWYQKELPNLVPGTITIIIKGLPAVPGSSVEQLTQCVCGCTCDQ